MSETQKPFFEPTFNRAIKVRKKDLHITSDTGAILLREADHRLGITAALADQMDDPRLQTSIRYKLVELIRERLYALALGYSAQDDLDLLAHDPAMKASVWDRPGCNVSVERLASQPTHSRLLNILTLSHNNREALRNSLPLAVIRHQQASGNGHAVLRGTLDIDGFPVKVTGAQAGAAYNGYHRQTEYYPLAASFSAGGDYDHQRLGDGFVNALLRKGNAGGADGALRFILNSVNKAKPLARVLDIRIDAAFVIGAIMDPLCKRKIRFLGRLRDNKALQKMASEYLSRPVGRPPKEGYEQVIELGGYQAKEWQYRQRVILVIIDKPDANGQLKLFPDYFYIATNWKREERTTRELLEHYRARGTFEDRLGEFNQAIGAHLSSPSFEANEAMLLLGLLAFNLAGILRGEVESVSFDGWDLGRFQRSVLKVGGRLVKGGRRLWFDLAASAGPLWECLIKRMRRWREYWTKPAQPRPRQWVLLPRHAHRSPVLRL